MVRRKLKLVSFLLAIGLVLTGCGDPANPAGPDLFVSEESEGYTGNIAGQYGIPEYEGMPYSVINGNTPFFSESDMTETAYEKYSPLDELGRPGAATACLGTETMPPEGEDRGEIGMVKPAGWHTVKYPDVIQGLYLYNRCHLIGWQLSNENANEQNLITGTRYLNVEGMLPFENLVADYIRQTQNHMLYRVTPVYTGSNLLCNGVLMEALSVEDSQISFCVFCYNVQPGITIDYATGDSYEGDPVNSSAPETTPVPSGEHYILNTNSRKIHREGCSAVDRISEKNKEDYYGDIGSLLEQGYAPCGACRPE